jgi:hypothetical protein
MIEPTCSGKADQETTIVDHRTPAVKLAEDRWQKIEAENPSEGAIEDRGESHARGDTAGDAQGEGQGAGKAT